MDKNANATAFMLRKLQEQVNALEQELLEMRSGGSAAYYNEIDAIPGRRVAFTLVASQTFTSTQDGVRGNAMTFEVSQDGPWVWTHYPFVVWKPSLPSNATDFGRWRPVSSYDLESQELTTNIIDISYQMQDSGPGRNFQNEIPVPPLLSRPFDLLELPYPTLFKTQSVVSFIPTYENILFNGGTATTQGTLVVALPGYKIVNL